MQLTEEMLRDRFRQLQRYDLEGRYFEVLLAFVFYTEDFYRPLGTFSGGELTRLYLAKMTLEPPEVLILDEPTNHIDIASRIGLERSLAPLREALVYISHDLSFSNKFVKEFGGYRPMALRRIQLATHLETKVSISDLSENKLPPLEDIQKIFYLKRNDGSCLHVRSLGSGSVSFVFIHGWGLDSQSWFPLMETLAPQHRSFALDLPGHGKSTLAGTKIELVEATVDLLHELRSPVILIGHSMGARVAALAASRCPSLVSGLVSVDGDVNGQSLAPRTRWKIVRHFTSDKGTRVTELYLARLCRGGVTANCWPHLESMTSVIPLEVKRQSLEWLLTNNEILNVRCPAHVILSDLTTTKYRKIAQQSAIPHASVEIIPDSDHFLPVSSTEVLADRLNRFHQKCTAL